MYERTRLTLRQSLEHLGGREFEPCDVAAAVLTRTAEHVLLEHPERRLGRDAEVPVDAVTASGSGLDPNISVANARLQAQRVADERGLDVDQVLDLVDDHTQTRALGFLGEDAVNVLELNLALDEVES